MRWIVWARSRSALAGGVISQAIGDRAALWVGAAGSPAVFLRGLLSPVRSIGTMPEPIVEPTHLVLAGALVERTPLPGPAAVDA